jgi:hypothetical protein
MDEQLHNVDMSSEAIATRLGRVSQLRRLCLSLGKVPLNDAVPAEESDNSPQLCEMSDQSEEIN